MDVQSHGVKYDNKLTHQRNSEGGRIIKKSTGKEAAVGETCYKE